jgi:hypothetical protein
MLRGARAGKTTNSNPPPPPPLVGTQCHLICTLFYSELMRVFGVVLEIVGA